MRTETDAEAVLTAMGYVTRPRRSYLVARQPGRDETLRNIRMDRIHAAETMDESFAFAPGFSLQNYAAQAFGAIRIPRNTVR